MYDILTLNKISPIGTERFPKEQFNISDSVENPDGILLRSYKMHDMELPSNLKAIGRAGAGVNNIPVEKCSEKGIVVFNTPGGNANAVKELVLAALLLGSRDIIGGIEWAKTLVGTTDVAKAVESGKSNFGGHEIYKKHIGIAGFGAIGVLVANACSDLGMVVSGVDPFMSVESAWHMHPSVRKLENINDFTDCDFISIHIPLSSETKHMFNMEYFKKLKPGVKILNFSRAELVNSEDIKQAISEGIVSQYITDFPTEETVGQPGIIAIPHLGASTEESEDNCAKMASREVRNYLLYGNITNSVNYPNCSLPYDGKTRITIAHQNKPKMLSKFLDMISNNGSNIDNMINKSKGDLAYTIIDIADNLDSAVTDALEQMEGVIRVRVI